MLSCKRAMAASVLMYVGVAVGWWAWGVRRLTRCRYARQAPARDQLERATLYQPVRAPEPLSDDIVDDSVVDGGTEPVGSGTGGDAGVLGPPDESEAARAEQVVE